MNPLDRTLVQRLDLVATLTDEDRDALRALSLTHKTVAAGTDIVVENQEVHHSCLLVDGFVHRYRDTREGKRQIIAFHVPGDIVDLHSLKFEKLDHNVAATIRCDLAFIRHEELWDLCMSRPNIAAALWRETLIDGSIFRRWIVALGRMSGIQRTAHLLCELTMRLHAMNTAQTQHFHLPLTQNELADALGLTVVTVNRTLQTLKQRGLVERNRTMLTIRNWPALAQIAGFEATYLHLRNPPAMDFSEDRQANASA
ncbi:Crp/Fnr family transcriptional regulator [Fulvimarina endophytica]|uniref:Crp/Fnr family transcriptional regulator n=1 Tax=Fulvimarina endophytica TaxID=2293836 RepID=A0A371X0F1_9HYPH|nr:Crp/Fnr family transcriptional regulator [Fulvimarina endophytica]RFC62717.1 Crp/Fnr family transcriptional regulator [Fulvimarina endophytica]